MYKARHRNLIDILLARTAEIPRKYGNARAEARKSDRLHLIGADRYHRTICRSIEDANTAGERDGALSFVTCPPDSRGENLFAKIQISCNGKAYF